MELLRFVGYITRANDCQIFLPEAATATPILQHCEETFGQLITQLQLKKARDEELKRQADEKKSEMAVAQYIEAERKAFAGEPLKRIKNDVLKLCAELLDEGMPSYGRSFAFF